MADVKILPGVYITVRDEGLISVGGIHVGNVGVVGVAPAGEPNKVRILTSHTEAKAVFETETGETGDLPRALEQIFANGARIVYAVRSPDETPENYAAALALLEKEDINIILLAGQDATKPGIAQALNEHLNTTQAQHHERIGIIGCNGVTDTAAVIDGKVVNDEGRLIYVAPGVRMQKRDPKTGVVTEEFATGALTAAAVAGLIASLPVHVSPTNKLLNLNGLAKEYGYGELNQLIKNNVLTIEKRQGYRVVRGVTTATNPAWLQITTRRIVDKSIYGVRAACQPYIGKLNNERVRGAMKATIDSFLTRLVEDEALTGYTLEVGATRAQEIAGEAIVTMTIQPTFSIDYISVTMYLV